MEGPAPQRGRWSRRTTGGITSQRRGCRVQGPRLGSRRNHSRRPARKRPAANPCRRTLTRRRRRANGAGAWNSRCDRMDCGFRVRSRCPSGGTRSRRGRDRKGARFVLTVERVPTIGLPDGSGTRRRRQSGEGTNKADIAGLVAVRTGSSPSAIDDRRRLERPRC